MSVYLVTGKLGSGKSLACVGRIRDVLRQRRQVATNLDIYLEKLMPASSRASLIRLPDKPSVADLDALGPGQDGVEEERNGVIVLDECAAWLNARSWGDKTRQGVIDWLIHSRKRGWDVYFIAQHLDQVDKQIRTALVEFLVVCRRWDRLAIPLLTSLVGVRPPKVHMAIVKYGTERESLIVDRWWYRGHDLYAAYDTRQVFRDEGTGSYCPLSAWHLRGRYGVRTGLAAFWAWCHGVDRRKPLQARPAWLAQVMLLPPAERFAVVRLLDTASEVYVGFPVRASIARGAGGVAVRPPPATCTPPSLVNCLGTWQGHGGAAEP